MPKLAQHSSSTNVIASAGGAALKSILKPQPLHRQTTVPKDNSRYARHTRQGSIDTTHIAHSDEELNEVKEDESVESLPDIVEEAEEERATASGRAD
jgi:hypothetical protein